MHFNLKLIDISLQIFHTLSVIFKTKASYTTLGSCQPLFLQLKSLYVVVTVILEAIYISQAYVCV